MNAIIFVAIGVTLFALTSGVFLLAKTRKDNLGIFYRVMALLIIVGCFLNFASTGMYCMMQFWSRHYYMEKEMKMHGRYMMDHGWMHRDHDMMRYHGGWMRGDEGNYMGEEECCQKKCCEAQGDSCVKQGTTKK